MVNFYCIFEFLLNIFDVMENFKMLFGFGVMWVKGIKVGVLEFFSEFMVVFIRDLRDLDLE